MSVNSRRKGAEGEREAAKLWRRWFPDCKRSFGQARKGYEQPDLIGGIEEHFYVEVKRTKKKPTDHRLNAWWEKLTEDRQRYLPAKYSRPYRLLMWRWDGQMMWRVKVGYLIAEKHGLADKLADWYCILWSDFAAALDKHFTIKEDV